MGLTGNKIHIRSYILAQEISVNPSKRTTDIVQGHTLRIKRVGEGAGGAGTLEPKGVGSIDGHSTTGDEDRTSSYACEVLTSVSSEITFDSSAEMVLCAATSSTAQQPI